MNGVAEVMQNLANVRGGTNFLVGVLTWFGGVLTLLGGGTNFQFGVLTWFGGY